MPRHEGHRHLADPPDRDSRARPTERCLDLDKVWPVEQRVQARPADYPNRTHARSLSTRLVPAMDERLRLPPIPARAVMMRLSASIHPRLIAPASASSNRFGVLADGRPCCCGDMRFPRPPTEESFRSPLHHPRVATVIGRWLGTAVVVCFLTGLI